MMTVNEVSKLTGISVRTLHYYDEIGLLIPAHVTDSGYRMYDEENLKRLQQIMLFRELEFSLKDIGRILGSPSFETQQALDDQIKLLTLKRDHLNELIEHAKAMKKKEEPKMSFKVYDKKKIEAYKKLAKEAWGETAAYKEYEKKVATKSDTAQRQDAEDMMNLFFEFGEMKAMKPGCAKVQAQVKKLQDFISENYYTCTKEILRGLGQLYVGGGDFTANIDAAGGKGTAKFVAEAIEIFCE